MDTTTIMLIANILIKRMGITWETRIPAIAALREIMNATGNEQFSSLKECKEAIEEELIRDMCNNAEDSSDLIKRIYATTLNPIRLDSIKSAAIRYLFRRLKEEEKQAEKPDEYISPFVG